MPRPSYEVALERLGEALGLAASPFQVAVCHVLALLVERVFGGQT